MSITLKEQRCTHGRGHDKFIFHSMGDRQALPGAFFCAYNCGFFIAYDPFEYPDGVCYLSETPQGKMYIKLSEGGKL